MSACLHAAAKPLSISYVIFHYTVTVTEIFRDAQVIENC